MGGLLPALNYFKMWVLRCSGARQDHPGAPCDVPLWYLHGFTGLHSNEPLCCIASQVQFARSFPPKCSLCALTRVYGPYVVTGAEFTSAKLTFDHKQNVPWAWDASQHLLLSSLKLQRSKGLTPFFLPHLRVPEFRPTSPSHCISSATLGAVRLWWQWPKWLF